MPTTEKTEDLDMQALGRRIMRKAEVMRFDAKARGAGHGLVSDLDELRTLGRLVAKRGGAVDV